MPAPAHNLPATTATLDTNKLLTLILSEVALDNRVSLRRVSKTWNHVITKIGFQLKPDHVGELDISHHCRPTSNNSISHYAHRIAIEPNPAMAMGIKLEVLNGTVDTRHTVKFAVQSWGGPCGVNGMRAPELQEKQHEFLTDPPITMVSINSASYRIHAMLRIPGGVRIGDLLDVLYKISAGHESTSWHYVFVCFEAC